jgi:hypothetical protein
VARKSLTKNISRNVQKSLVKKTAELEEGKQFSSLALLEKWSIFLNAGLRRQPRGTS